MLVPSPDHILQSSFAAMKLTTLSLFHSDTHFSIGLEAKEEKGVNNSPVLKNSTPVSPRSLSNIIREQRRHAFSCLPACFLYSRVWGGAEWHPYPRGLAVFGPQYIALCIEYFAWNMH